MHLRAPQTLAIVRHGQSAGNVARDEAEAAGRALIDIATRDIDVPLSPLGERQAEALGEWLGSLPEDRQPTVVISSPYRRAGDSAARMVAAAGLEGRICVRRDERLREKEFGILDRLTHLGISERHPELYAQRAHVGKFYFRPPGGESWCDVILRLRGMMDTLALEHDGERVLLMAHQVIVNCMRYLLERLSEEEILAIDRQGDVPNCGLTEYGFDPAGGPGGRWVLHQANYVQPLREAGAPVTAESDAQAAVKP